MNESIIIKTPARIHINLFSMNNKGYRQNGGIGFCINDFDTAIRFSRADNFKIVDNRSIGLSKPEIESFQLFLENSHILRKLKVKMSVEFLYGPPPHSGFGTGTSSKLAAIEAANYFNFIECSQTEIIKLSGRGGTSGVGISTYFQGGLNIDLGVINRNLIFAPSSARENPSQP